MMALRRRDDNPDAHLQESSRIVSSPVRMDAAIRHLSMSRLEDVRVDAETHDWIFRFTGDMTLRVSAAWRVVAGAEVRAGWQDDQQWFGLSAPLDLHARVRSLVNDSDVDATTVNEYGDLTVRFTSGCSLQVFNDSCGYEGWELCGPGERSVVGQGGGRVVDSDAKG